MRFAAFLLFLFLFFSCQNPPAESRADRIAKGVCDCSSRLLIMNYQAANATGTIDFKGIQAEYENAKTCIQNQHMKPEDLPEVQKALAVKCPELAKETELMGELLGK